jgi:hypothetical protein
VQVNEAMPTAAPDQLADQLQMALLALGIPMPGIEKSPIPYRPTQRGSSALLQLRIA